MEKEIREQRQKQEAAALDMLAALKAIRDVRDYFAENNEYPANTIGKDQCFDDWAADLASVAINKAGGGK